MCGLVGIFGNIHSGDTSTFKQLLIASSVRGPHSTGVGFGARSGESTYLKSVGDPYKYFNLSSKDHPELDTDAVWGKWWNRSVAVIGHNRWATSGAINSENAHPFKRDHILLAHNGSLINHRSLLSNSAGFEVDSDIATQHIANVGIEQAVKDIDGAFCFTFFNEKDKTFQIIRNNERPMWIAELEYRNTWFYASEPEMLMWVLNRTKTRFKDLFQPKVGELLTWSADSPNKLPRDNVLKLHEPKHYRGSIWNSRGNGYYGHQMDYGVPDEYNASDWKPKEWPPSSKSSAKPEEKSEGKKEASKVVNITDNNRPRVQDRTRGNYSRDYAGGNQYLIERGIIRTQDKRWWVGWFDSFTPHSAKSKVTDDSHGMVWGCCDDPNASDAILAISNMTFREAKKLIGMDSAITGSYLEFQIDSCYYDKEMKVYVIAGSKYREPNMGTNSEWNLIPLLPLEKDKKTAEEVRSPAGEPALLNQTEYVKGFEGVPIAMELFLRNVEHGCQKCGNSLKVSDAPYITWIDLVTPLCVVCASGLRNSNMEKYRKVEETQSAIPKIH